jgi:DNA-binding response OmpR family regulator
MSQIFVVTTDKANLNAMLGVFEHAGYSATGVTTFDEAQQRLASESPRLVIADERLGLFNGLHVLLTARARHPDVDLIVTTPKFSLGLELDARSLNVHCVVRPQHVDEWVAPVADFFEPVACVA